MSESNTNIVPTTGTANADDYQVSTPSFTRALTQLVARFVKLNPGIFKFEASGANDAWKVVLTIKPPKKGKAAPTINPKKGGLK